MGFASHSMLVVKANRALLHKRRSYKDIRDVYEGLIDETQLQFKELTPFEQKKIRDKIIEQAKRDRMEELKIYLISFVALCFFILGIYALFFSWWLWLFDSIDNHFIGGIFKHIDLDDVLCIFQKSDTIFAQVP